MHIRLFLYSAGDRIPLSLPSLINHHLLYSVSRPKHTTYHILIHLTRTPQKNSVPVLN